MADISLIKGGTGGKLPNFMKAGVYQVVVDFAEALSTKGSALAAADVLQIMTIPAGCVIECACLSPVSGHAINALATALTLDLGDDAGDDSLVNGFNAALTTEGVPVMTVEKFYPAADTLDITIATLTGTLTSGKVLVSVKIYELTVSDLNGTA